MTTQKTTVPHDLTLVVGIQNDDTGMHAWHRAVDIAKSAERVFVHLCHCAGDAQGDVATTLTAAENLLGKWAAAQLFGDDLIRRAEIHVAVGDPAAALRQLAVDVKADMIIVGTHQKGALRRLVDGSVVQNLLDDSPCSVVVAMPTDYTNREASPQIESAPPPKAATRQLGVPHHYSYRRAVKMNFPSSSFGLERTPS